MTDFTNLSNALETLINEIRGTSANLLGTANTQRKQLLELRKAMIETQNDIVAFADIVGGAADSFTAVENVCYDVADKVGAVFEEGLDMLPDCEYEDFIGFCDICGATVAEYDEYDNADGIVCAACLPEEESDPSDEEITA